MHLLIIDDESPARRELRRLLRTIAPEASTAEASSLAEARAALAREDFDGIFLDLKMPGASGIEFFPEAALAGVPVIVATAYEQHAVECIDRGAVGYLLKPIDPEMLSRALMRLRQKSAAHSNGDASLILLSDHKHYWPLLPDDILKITADDGYSNVQLKDGRELTLSRTLKEIEKLLEGHRFIRANRGEIINLSHSKVIHRKNDGGIIAEMNGCEPVVFSRRQAKALRASKFL